MAFWIGELALVAADGMQTVLPRGLLLICGQVVRGTQCLRACGSGKRQGSVLQQGLVDAVEGLQEAGLEVLRQSREEQPPD